MLIVEFAPGIVKLHNGIRGSRCIGIRIPFVVFFICAIILVVFSKTREVVGVVCNVNVAEDIVYTFHVAEDLMLAVAAAKRAEELKEQTDFYRIKLSETDIKEIEMLRGVIPYLRDKESLNKIIWKVFYEKPTSDLIGRVVGSGTHTGIYKITNIPNGMCYVG